MNKLHKLMSNLQYVTVDRAAAREHWWTLVEMSQLSPEVYALNRQMIVENKATAGILSHKQTRGFIMHRMRERNVHRRLKREAEQARLIEIENRLSSIDFVGTAKQAKQAARDCIEGARMADHNGTVFTHRGVEVTVSLNGRREGDAYFLEVNQLSGKALKKALDWFDDIEYDEVWVSGGLDAYDSLEALMNHWDYDPWVESWEVPLLEVAA